MENLKDIIMIIFSILIGICGNAMFEQDPTIKNFMKVLIICLGMIVLNVFIINLVFGFIDMLPYIFEQINSCIG